MKSYFAHGDSAQREEPSTCLFESIVKSAISCQCTWTNVLREFGPAKLHRRPERSVHPSPRSTSSVRLFDGTIPWQVYSRNRKPALTAICGARDWFFHAVGASSPESSAAKALRTSDWDKPNWRAMREGVTPALNAARTAFN